MPNEIDTRDLKQLKANRDDLLVLDVREPDAYRERHIPGAKNAPVDDADVFDQVVKQEAPDAHVAVVAYADDRADRRSARAAQRLEDLGYIEVHDLVEGMEAWAALPTHSEGGGAAPATEETHGWTPGGPPRR